MLDYEGISEIQKKFMNTKKDRFRNIDHAVNYKFIIMENATGNCPVIETLPGTKPDSIINDVHALLRKGAVLTTLDAVNSNRTVCLPKYISILRLQFGVQISTKWIELSNNKRIKQYWIQEKVKHC